MGNGILVKDKTEYKKIYETTSDGVQTYAQILQQFTSYVVNGEHYKYLLKINEKIYHPMTQYDFIEIDGSSTGTLNIIIREAYINGNLSGFFEANSSFSITNYSNMVPGVGNVYTLYKLQ